jgi:hypothetical protein
MLCWILDTPLIVPVRAAVHPDGGLPVFPLRVSDVAEMEAWALSRSGDPMAGLADALAVDDEAERRKAMRAILDRCHDLPGLWSDGWTRAFAGPIGDRAMLWFFLRRSFGPGWDRLAAAELLPTLTPDEFAAIGQAAWRMDPKSALLLRTMSGGPRKSVDPDDEIEPDWLWRLVDRFSRDRHLSYAEIAAMPFRALLLGIAGDKHSRDVLPTRPGESAGQAMRRFRELFGRAE